jgi:anthranilate synthase component 1
MMKKLLIIKRKFDEIKSELFKLSIQSSIKNLSNSKDKTVKEIKG